jgi:hypothetical protein
MTSQTEAPVYRYKVKYVIVDPFGELLWQGFCIINQEQTRPTGEAEVALLDVQTSKVVRGSTPPEAPPGRVIITAVFPT